IAHRAIQTSVIEKEEQGTVVIESIRHELREVESRPGEKKKEECVVVRLSYPKGRPFFADIPNAIGAEHRFYTDAGKYTGVFFRLTESQAKEQINTINLFSLENFKRKAIHVPGLELGEPNPREARPQQENEPGDTR